MSLPQEPIEPGGRRDRARLGLELEQAVALGTHLATNEHPMLLFAQWLNWNNAIYWLLNDALGQREADEFVRAGGRLHRDQTQMRRQVEHLVALLDRLDSLALSSDWQH